MGLISKVTHSVKNVVDGALDHPGRTAGQIVGTVYGGPIGGTVGSYAGATADKVIFDTDSNETQTMETLIENPYDSDTAMQTAANLYLQQIVGTQLDSFC